MVTTGNNCSELYGNLKLKIIEHQNRISAISFEGPHSFELRAGLRFGRFYNISLLLIYNAALMQYTKLNNVFSIEQFIPQPALRISLFHSH